MQPFLQVKEWTISLPGVTGEHSFYQISDCHVATCNEASEETEIAEAKRRQERWIGTRAYFAKKYGEPLCPEPPLPGTDCLSLLVNEARRHPCECLLLSGDLLDYPHPAGFAFLDQLLADLPMPYLFAVGNHDGTYADCPALLKYNQNTDGVTTYHGQGFIIAAVNDAFLTLPDKHLAEVKALSEGDTPVILLMHAPIANDYCGESMKKIGDYFLMKDTSPDANAAAFVKMVSSPDSAVAAILCGHAHGFANTFFAPGKPLICTSSGLVGGMSHIVVKGL